MTRMLYFVVIIIGFVTLIPSPTFAQGVPQGANVFITSNPKFPEPFTPVQLTLEAYGVTALDNEISWYIDGVLFRSGTRSITVTSKNIASSTHIRALVGQGSASFTTETTIKPSILTILLESSLPSSPFVREKMNIPADTPLTAIALLDRGTPSEQYTYRWELGEGNSGRKNGQRYSFTMPEFDDILFVTVLDTNGTIVHEGGVTLIPGIPKISLYSYKNNTIFPFPLAGSYIPQEDTEAFLAVIRNNTATTPTWFLNGVPLVNLEIPSLVTLGQLLTANAELRISVPYGAYRTLTTEHSVRIAR